VKTGIEAKVTDLPFVRGSWYEMESRDKVSDLLGSLCLFVTLFEMNALAINWLCGFAASRAESLRLSVTFATPLAATPPEATPQLF
jgi:hypothetical protein